MNDLVPVLPVNLALRLNQSSSKFGFTQNLGGGYSGDFKSKTTVQEVGVYLSPKLPVVEPYVGIGAVNADGDLSFSGPVSIFQGGGTTSSSKISSTKMVAGLSVQLPFFSFGIEYQNLFGTSGYGLKLGLSF